MYSGNVIAGRLPHLHTYIKRAGHQYEDPMYIKLKLSNNPVKSFDLPSLKFYPQMPNLAGRKCLRAVVLLPLDMALV